MKRTTAILFITAGLLSLSARGEIIRLKNGVELHCEILTCSEEEGLTVKRLDNGGVIALRWDHMLDSDAQAIRYARGYSSEEAKTVLVRATRVWLRNGTFEDGIKVESDRPGTMCLKRRGQLIYLMQNQVNDIESVEVEAKEIRTLEELLQLKLDEGMPETALEYFAFGVYLESITYYVKALEMYEKVRELDPEYKADVMNQKIKLMELKIHESDATALLDEIKQLIYRKKFNLAMERIVVFEERFPDSVQIGDKEKLKGRALTKRHAFFQEKILTDYFTYMERIARKVAANQEIKLEEAQDFAVEEMGPTVRLKLAEDIFKISLEEVEELWANRKGGAPRISSYGTGTFILGEERAKAIPEDKEEEEDAKKEEEKKKPQTSDERLKKAIEALRKQQDKSKKKKKSKVRIDDIGRTPEEWWETESISNRQRFLVAYYAEMSGDMKILKVWLNLCPHCNGVGYLEKMSTTGQEDQSIPCEVCKGLGVERTIRFK